MNIIVIYEYYITPKFFILDAVSIKTDEILRFFFQEEKNINAKLI